MYVDLARQFNDVLGAGRYAQHATLASGRVNHDSAFHFCHILLFKD
jgi:hypothetical protein